MEKALTEPLILAKICGRKSGRTCNKSSHLCGGKTRDMYGKFVIPI
jgi:hypothetical protein